MVVPKEIPAVEEIMALHSMRNGQEQIGDTCALSDHIISKVEDGVAAFNVYKLGTCNNSTCIGHAIK